MGRSGCRQGFELMLYAAQQRSLSCDNNNSKPCPQALLAHCPSYALTQLLHNQYPQHHSLCSCHDKKQGLQAGFRSLSSTSNKRLTKDDNNSNPAHSLCLPTAPRMRSQCSSVQIPHKHCKATTPLPPSPFLAGQQPIRSPNPIPVAPKLPQKALLPQHTPLLPSPFLAGQQPVDRLPPGPTSHCQLQVSSTRTHHIQCLQPQLQQRRRLSRPGSRPARAATAAGGCGG